MSAHVAGAADVTTSFFIDGKWSDSGSDHALPVFNPANGELITQINYGGHQQAVAAADAAADAFAAWSTRPARERADLLSAIASLVASRAAEIGRLLSRESGKRLAEAEAEVRFASDYFRWFAEEVRRPSGDLIASNPGGQRQLSIRRATGVAVCLTPWNFPVSIQARKLAAALAAGCTTVSRPSEKAPLAVIELFRCLEAAGLPAGVANLINGSAATQAQSLIQHPAVRIVSFTGSTPVGVELMAGCAGRVVRPLLELGGDAAFIVFDDADVDAAVEGAMAAKFRNNGQSCIAANRFVVHDKVYSSFRERFVAAVDAMTIGNPLNDESTQLGPVIDDDRAASLHALVDDAEERGARRLSRRRNLPPQGIYFAPAILEDVSPSAGMAQQEVFGPIAGMFRFQTEAEALQLANDTTMGLAAYCYTQDSGRAWRMIDGLDAGIIGLNDPLPSAANAPLGGTKSSGIGREGARIGLEEYCDVHYVSWRP